VHVISGLTQPRFLRGANSFGRLLEIQGDGGSVDGLVLASLLRSFIVAGGEGQHGQSVGTRKKRLTLLPRRKADDRGRSS